MKFLGKFLAIAALLLVPVVGIADSTYSALSQQSVYALILDNVDANKDGIIDSRLTFWITGKVSFDANVSRVAEYNATTKTVKVTGRGWSGRLTNPAICDATLQVVNGKGFFTCSIYKDVNGQRGALIYVTPKSVPMFLTTVTF